MHRTELTKETYIELINFLLDLFLSVIDVITKNPIIKRRSMDRLRRPQEGR